MLPKISVIMPSLNVADYIKSCMESVLCQTFSDIEVIAVDAGSTDGTWEILEEYEKRDSRIRLIKSEKRSYGYQLNKGIDLARGEYIAIVETDDRIALDAYEILFRAAQETKADYVKGTAEVFTENPIGDDICHDMKVFTSKEYEASQGIIMLAPQDHPELVMLDYYLWNGIYRREFVKNIRLNESAGAAYQDIGFMFQVHSNAEWAVYLDKLVYHYRRDNVNSSCYNRKAFHYLVDEYCYVDRFLETRSEAWHSACCCKLFRQAKARFYTMAHSGEFWEEALPDILILTGRITAAIGQGLKIQEILTDEEWKEAQCMLESPKQLFDCYERPFRKKKEFLQSIFRTIENHNVVIFGCGKWGRFCHILLENNRCKTVLAYCDNNQGLWETAIQGIPVMNPEQAVKRYPEAYYVIANKYSVQELKAQLRSLGVEKERILEYTIGLDMQMLNIR